MSDNRLCRLCRQLAYTKSDLLTEDIFSETFSAYRELCSEFGEATVLIELSKLWSKEKAALFFDRMRPGPSARRHISTVAVHYHRAHSGGVERVQAQLITLWIKMGYRVLLLTEEPENPLDYPYPAAVQRFLIPGMSRKKARLSAIAKICSDENVDIFVNHNWLSSTAVWECILLKSLNIPFIQYVHGHFAMGMRLGRSALSQPALFRLCDFIIALSRTNARFFQLCPVKAAAQDKEQAAPHLTAQTVLCRTKQNCQHIHTPKGNNMEAHKISVILPVYNGAKFVGKSIESVLNQTYKNLELIIVNDCSKDNTLEVISAYAAADSRIHVLNNETNQKICTLFTGQSVRRVHFLVSHGGLPVKSFTALHFSVIIWFLCSYFIGFIIMYSACSEPSLNIKASGRTPAILKPYFS